MAPVEAAGGRDSGARGKGKCQERSQGRKRRGNFALINTKLLAVADSGDLERLVAFIASHCNQMNLVNLSTALHRLAKLTGTHQDNRTWLWRQQAVPDMMEAVSDRVLHMEANGCATHCQALSNIIWALATLRYSDQRLLTTLATCARRHVKFFKSFELSSILWGLAKFEVADGSLFDCVAPFFAAAAAHIAECIGDFSFRCLVMTAWAFAAHRACDVEFLSRVAHSMQPTLRTASCSELSNVAWAFKAVSSCSEEFLNDLASCCSRQISAFEPHDLAIVIRAFAARGFFVAHVFESAASAPQLKRLCAADAGSVLSALAHLRPAHRASRRMCLQLLSRCCSEVGAIQASDLVGAVLAAAKSVGTGSAKGSSDGFAQSQQLSRATADFLIAALPWLAARLIGLSGRDLLSIATAYLTVDLSSGVARTLCGAAHSVTAGAANLLDGISCEIVRRVAAFESAVLLRLLRNFAASPSPTDARVVAVCALFGEASRRVDVLSPGELHLLSRTCARHCEQCDITCSVGLRRDDGGGVVDAGLNRNELRKLCRELGGGMALPLNELPCFRSTVGTSSEVAQCIAHSEESMPGSTMCSISEKSDGSSGCEEGCHGSVDQKFVHGIGCRRPLPPLHAFLRGDASWFCPEKLNSYRNRYRQFREGNGVLAKEDISTSIVLDGDLEVATYLPPPLKIIPHTVSETKVAAYRRDYQRFRQGLWKGAKGEVQDLLSDEPRAISCKVLFISRTSLAEAREVAIELSDDMSGQPSGSSTPPSRVGGEDADPGDAAAAGRGARPPFFGSGGGASTGGALPAAIGLKVSVKNTFLHIKDDSDGDEEDGCGGSSDGGSRGDSSRASKPLPPPLKIIPTDISEERLNTYRMDYQKFRTGKANGARGEISRAAAGTPLSHVA